MNDSKWKIDDADMNLVKGPHVSRYYAKKEIRCHNCSKEGHLSRDCSEPKVGHFIHIELDKKYVMHMYEHSSEKSIYTYTVKSFALGIVP